MFERIIIIVMDSVGIGALPDASGYGDSGANTVANIARSQGGLFLPTLEKLGLGCIEFITGLRHDIQPMASYGKMAELSIGKDTTSGHWELAGCPVFTPFPLYPNGFPPEIIAKFKQYTGLDVLGNKAASGTEIIDELGEEHIRTGSPIVYTSADSVFQIAAHEDVIKLSELYEICEIVREKICVDKHAVGRIIARPFIGEPGNFSRTANRHDYSLEPTGTTILEAVRDAGHEVIGVGKIADIYANRGLTRSYPTKSNKHGMETLFDILSRVEHNALIMLNLVDFDSVFGHRNDINGYARALEDFDTKLALLLPQLKHSDLLILTADHGCDPTLPGTDHTREYVPLLAYHPGESTKNLGIRTSFADVAATVAENFRIPAFKYGRSFLQEILR